MRLPISTVGPDVEYSDATDSHMKSSASSLADLARIVSGAPRQPDARPLYVRLSHFEHGAFLSPMLFGFWILEATGQIATRSAIPGVEDGSELPMSLLRPAGDSSPEHPVIYAVVANHPVSVQIEHTLATLAMLIARQEVVSSAVGEGMDRIDELTTQADARAFAAVRDTLRSHGWHAAAEAIRTRSEAAGLPLIVSYSTVLMNQSQLATRAPILRHIYNSLPTVREAVDKVAALVSQGMTMVGGGSQEVGAFARNLLDIGLTRTYLAHLARDAFVCGNGYLSYGSAPDEDTQLLLPESVRAVERMKEGLERVTTEDGNIYGTVLHITGAEQQDSVYGLSVLEPFVEVQLKRDLAMSLLKKAAAYERLSAPEPYRSEANANVPLAQRILEWSDSRATELLGGPRTLHVMVPADLYFTGHELLTPAAGGISTSDPGAR